jgi:hypothetical protein
LIAQSVYGLPLNLQKQSSWAWSGLKTFFVLGLGPVENSFKKKTNKNLKSLVLLFSGLV